MKRPTLAEAMQLRSRGFEPLQVLAEAAYMLCSMKDLRRAGELVNAILQIAPNDPCSHLLHAKLTLGQGQLNTATAAAKQAARLAGSDASTLSTALNLRGRAAYLAHRFTEAEKAWKDARAADPDGPAGNEANGLLRDCCPRVVHTTRR